MTSHIGEGRTDESRNKEELWGIKAKLWDNDGNGCRARAVVATAFMVAKECRARAVVARA